VPGCGLEVKISNVEAMVAAADNSDAMANFYNAMSCVSSLR
jgi:hypothetical protein